MKEKAYMFLFIVGIIYLIAGTIAVEYDKDVSACVSDFKAEVNEIEGRDLAMNMLGGGNENYAEEVKQIGPDFPYNGSLDPIIEARDRVLREKSVLMLGTWWTGIKGGMREADTFSFYIPLKPWKLRYS